MIVAIFGDVHGNLPGMYACCQDWQQQYAKQINLVLQTGDMGLWRSHKEMDKATKKHYAKDESELAATYYLSGRCTASIETWFVHGNHENFSLLTEREGKAVDPKGRIIFLTPGSIREYHKDKETLRVAALGGMEYRFGKFSLPTNERVQKYLHPQSLERLLRQAQRGLLNDKSKVNVLLMHDAPLNKGLRNKFPTGSDRITKLIEVIKPRFVFFGHYNDPPEPFYLGSTLCAGMNYRQAKRIPNRDGAMGILQTEPWQFSFVEP